MDDPAHIWARWGREPEFRSEIPESRYAEALGLAAFALNQLPEPSINFIDVGCARGDVLAILRDRTGLSKTIRSIGVDPLDYPGRQPYGRFFQVAIEDSDRAFGAFNVHKEPSCSSLKEVIRPMLSIIPRRPTASPIWLQNRSRRWLSGARFRCSGWPA